MNDKDYAAQVITQHEAALDAAKAKVDKLETHLDGAREGVEQAEAALAEARRADHTFVEPTENVTVQAG